MTPHTSSYDRVRIFIHDCRVDLKVGVHESEWERTQPVIINIECEGCLIRRYDDIVEKELSSIINYNPLYTYITTDLLAMGHIYLLESVAEKIIDFCFRDVRIEKVSVRLEKISIFPHATGGGIEIIRIRS